MYSVFKGKFNDSSTGYNVFGSPQLVLADERDDAVNISALSSSPAAGPGEAGRDAASNAGPASSFSGGAATLQPGPAGVGGGGDAAAVDSLLARFRADWRLFELDGPIGEGHFGQVFLAKFQGRQVAVKRIVRERFRKSNAAELFVKELTVQAQIPRHPNIVSFIAIAQSSSSNWLAFEYVAGGSLRGFLDDRRALSSLASVPEVRLDVARGVAAGMAFLHGLTPAPILHRDLTSNNVLLAPTASAPSGLSAKLCDFGLARVKSETGPLTAQMGSLAWMAPETFRGEPYGEPADVYSAAVVCWELVTLRSPALEMTHPHLLAERVATGYRLPLATATPAWQRLIGAMWHADPGCRPSFDDVSAQLHRDAAALLAPPTREAVYEKMGLKMQQQNDDEPLYVDYAENYENGGPDSVVPSYVPVPHAPLPPAAHSAVLTGHEDMVIGLDVREGEGRKVSLCSSAADGTVKLFEVLPPPADYRDTAASAAAAAAAAVGWSWRETGSILAHGGHAHGVRFLPRLVASCGADCAVRLWDDASLTLRAEWTGHSAPVRALCVSPDGATVASGCQAGKLRLWSVERGLAGQVDVGRQLYCAEFVEPGLVATGAADGVVRCFDTRDPRRPCVALEGHSAAVLCLAAGPVRGTLMSGSRDRSVLAFDWRSASLPLRQYLHNQAAVRALAVVPGQRTWPVVPADQQTLFTAADNGEILAVRVDGADEGVGRHLHHPHDGHMIFQLRVQSHFVAACSADQTISLSLL